MKNKNIKQAMKLLEGYEYFITGTSVLNEINNAIVAKDVDVQVSHADYDNICATLAMGAKIVEGTELSRSHTEFLIDGLWIDIISDENFDYTKNDMDILRIAINEKGELLGVTPEIKDQIENRKIKHMNFSNPAMDLGRVAKYIDKGFTVDAALTSKATELFIESLTPEGRATLEYNRASIIKSEIAEKVIVSNTTAKVRHNESVGLNKYDGVEGSMRTIKAHAATFGALLVA